MVTYGTHFFGYGSLVNLATHSYENPKKATVKGWRRQWVYSATRGQSFLSVAKDAQSSIQGLIASVSDVGWEALDERETEYNRVELAQTELDTGAHTGVQIYVAAPDHVAPKSPDKPILLSYLDCVVQGFLHQFGEEGVTSFFDSTAGWDRPIKNDRVSPIYPRAQNLNVDQSQLVDHHLKRISAVIET